MSGSERVRFGCGLSLLLVGVALLALRLSPTVEGWVQDNFTWPLIIVGVGMLILIFGVLSNVPGLAVPAAIVGGIGGLLFWQEATGNWESWAYAWALIPGFVGVGTLLMGLLEGGRADSLRAGAWLIVISLFLFVIFSSFLGGANLLGPYWPVLLILLGLIMLGQSLIGGRRKSSPES
jgi:hypothetical protein